MSHYVCIPYTDESRILWKEWNIGAFAKGQLSLPNGMRVQDTAVYNCIKEALQAVSAASLHCPAKHQEQ